VRPVGVERASYGPGASDSQLRRYAEALSIPDIDLPLLRRALLHTSALSPHSLESNERLEFLGDSIVNAAIAHYLHESNPTWTEGDLAKGRALVVSKPSLYEAGFRLGLTDMIVVGFNAEGAFARGRRSLVADAVEALVAAIFLQYGWERARAYVVNALDVELSALSSRSDLRDAKTILQERSQSRKEPPPVYKILSEEGDPHARVFVSEVTVERGQSATGSGRSKKDAEQAAAVALLELLARATV
jgi:ribonuclease-3